MRYLSIGFATIITTFHKRLIAAGVDWTEALDQHLNTSLVILLLISADFVASDYCYGVEMQRAMERQRAGEAHVIPILLRPVDWHSAPFGQLNALPSNERPVTSWANRDEAFADIVQGIRAILGYGKPRPVPFMVEDLPANFVQRPQEFELLVRCLLNEKREEPVAITATLRGAGGYGKTTLARALCHNEHVRETFDDGILWITFGEQPGNLINKIEDLIYILSGEKPGYTSQEAATTHLVKLLADRSILLVLDDVWNSAHLTPFLQGGKRCARLITTRDERVVPSSVPLAQRIQVDAMQLDEAIQLLISGVQGEDTQALLKQHPTELKRLVTRLGEWPLLLKLASSMLEERINIHMQDVSHAITAVHRALDKRGVAAFDQSNPVERSQAVAKTIDISFELLQPEEKARYQELAIFPEDVDIPLPTLQHFWGRTGNLDEFDTEELCIRLRSLSLLLQYNPVTRTIRLHDVMRNYLQHQSTLAELALLHARFLDAYPVKRWADLPQHEPYLWDRLATHLIAAGRTTELLTTVMDGAYLVSKAHYRPMSLLEQDLELAIEHAPDYPALRRLQHSISNMAHLLRECATWQECACVLHSRLVHLPELQSVCQSLENRVKQPCLTAWHPLPDLPMVALKRTITGHTSSVNSCAISPDGSWFLSVSYDGFLRIWDTVSAQCGYNRRIGPANFCAISPNGKWLLSVADLVKIWDTASGQLRHTHSVHPNKPGRVTACAISPDGTWLLVASSDYVRDPDSKRLLPPSISYDCWDTASGKIRRTIPRQSNQNDLVPVDSVRACAISPDGTWFLSAFRNHIEIWDVASGQCLQTFAGHTSWVTACAISPDGTWFLSASRDHTLKTWDVASGQCLHTFAGHTNSVTACAISPDGTWFLSASRDHTLRIWNTATGQSSPPLTGHTDEVNTCAISPDGKWLLSASSDRTLRIWEAASDQGNPSLAGHTDGIITCAISPDGKWLLSASYDCTLRIWETASGELRHTLSGHTNAFTTCAISPDGKWLLSASYDYTLRIWETASGKLRHILSDRTSWARACAISPDSKWFLSASRDHTLKIWDVASGKLLHTLTGHTDSVNACAISSDGAWLLSASDDHTLRVWDVASGKLLHTLFGHVDSVNVCAISPDGTWFLSASIDGSLKIWDVASGKLLHTLSSHTHWITACAISPDGAWFLSASRDHTLRIWDVASGKLLHTLSDHTDSVNACAISPDGTRLLSASDDHTLRVWDPVTKICIATLRVTGALRSCLFCGDQYHIIAGGERGVYFLRVVDGE